MTKIKKSYLSSNGLSQKKTGLTGKNVAVINSPGNYVRTGSWATKKPKSFPDCLGCGVCVANCPEAAIVLGEKRVKIDYDFCKGCGICVEVCPRKAILF